ncbi:MAG: hypothetical protein ABSA30_13220, partial [Candidatus Aminicenantales bacterium]
KAEKLWSYQNGKDGYAVSYLTGDYVYSLSNQGPLVVLNAKDGSELWRGASPGANAPGFSRVNDRVLLHPDSAHNCGTPQIMYSIAGKDTKQMCAWTPPINPTNPYNRPPGAYWSSVVADGRIFVRGADGIYCFDIRKK